MIGFVVAAFADVFSRNTPVVAWGVAVVLVWKFIGAMVSRMR